MVLLGLLLASLGLAPQDAKGQRWLQTSKVVTPIEQGPVRTMLDTLVRVAERRKRKVQRAADDTSQMSVSSLRSTLIEKSGIGLTSANRALIEYRFSIGGGSDVHQKIAGVHFVYRPGPNQTDIPVLYLDADKDWVRQALHNKGTELNTNEAALIPFRRHLEFARIARQKETQIVEIGGQTVREGFHAKKEALIQKVKRLTYESYV